MVDHIDTEAPTNDIHSPGSSISANPRLRTKRVLACVLCQQRKVKCDRNFPCANCKRTGAQCVSAVTAQPRRRRFAERELLDRLRQYEELLRHNNVDFKPMHPPNIIGSQGAGSPEHDGENGDVVSVGKAAADPNDKPETAYEFDPDMCDHVRPG